MKVSFYIQPGARNSELCGRHDGHIKIKLKSPPTEGLANNELIRFLSSWLGFPKNHFSIVSGQKSRKKTIQIDYLTESEKQNLQLKLNSI